MDKQCNICGLIKNESDFYKSQRSLKCKKCILEINKNYKHNKRKNPEYKFSEKLKQKERRIRLWQNTLLHDSKYRNIEHNIEINYINELFEKQNGLCYWFNIPLIPSEIKKHPQQPSLDRLDINKGYVKDNVVLCCYAANIGRNETNIIIWETFLKQLFNKK